MKECKELDAKRCNTPDICSNCTFSWENVFPSSNTTQCKLHWIISIAVYRIFLGMFQTFVGILECKITTWKESLINLVKISLVVNGLLLTVSDVMTKTLNKEQIFSA